MHVAVPVAAHDHRVEADVADHEVALVRDLRFVGDEQPHPVEDPFHLQREDLRVASDSRRHLARLDPDEVIDERPVR